MTSHHETKTPDMERQESQPKSQNVPSQETSGDRRPSPCSAILARIKGLDVSKVMASTQYGMGFILTEDSGICFRDDEMSHSDRVTLAAEVNVFLRPRFYG